MRVLIPTDFSKNFKSIITSLNPEIAEEVYLLNVVDVLRFAGLDFDVYPWVKREISKRLCKLSKIAETLERRGFKCFFYVTVGYPPLEIIELARRNSVDLIAMGARGRNVLKNSPIGSVTEEVILNGRTPVLIYRNNGKKVFDHVLVAYDFSKCSEFMLNYVLRFKPKKVTILHVIERTFSESILKSKMTEIEGKGIRCEVIVRKGDPHKEILKALESIDPTSIAIGCNGVGARNCIGTVADIVTRFSKTSVLVFKKLYKLGI